MKIHFQIIFLLVVIRSSAHSQECKSFGKLKEIIRFLKSDEAGYVIKWKPSNVASIIRRVGVFEQIAETSANVSTKFRSIRKNVLSPIIKENRGNSDGSLNIGETRYERHYRIEKVESDKGSPSDLYDDCHERRGVFPSILNAHDEVELLALAVKYQLNGLLVEALLDRHFGPTSYNGYLISKWSADSDSGNLRKPKTADFTKATFRHLLFYNIANVDVPSNVSVLSRATLFHLDEHPNLKPIHSLCMVRKPMYQLSVDQLNAVEITANKLGFVSQQIADSLREKVKLLEKIAERGDDTVEDPPEGSLNSGYLQLGVESYAAAIFPLSQEYFYDDEDRNHLITMNQALTWMGESLKSEIIQSEGWMSLFPSQDLKDAIIDTCLKTRHKLESEDLDPGLLRAVFSPLLHEVQIRLESVDGATATTDATIRFVSSSKPTIVQRIQKYVMPTGKILTHNFLVSDSESYTTLKRPNTIGCIMLGPFQSCSHIELELADDGEDVPVKDVRCGEGLVKHSSTDDCLMEDFDSSLPILLSHQGCEDEGGNLIYKDILNSGFAGKLTKECENMEKEEISFDIGVTRLNSTLLDSCNYFYDGQGIYGKQDLMSLEDARHQTILGSYTSKQIRWLLPTLIMVIVSITICVFLTFCPRPQRCLRRWIFCCFHDDGLHNWTLEVKQKARSCGDCCSKPTQILPMADVSVEPQQPIVNQPIVAERVIYLPSGAHRIRHPETLNMNEVFAGIHPHRA